MPKKLQDIVRPKKSLKEVIPSATAKSTKRKSTVESPSVTPPRPPHTIEQEYVTSYRNDRPRGGSKLIVSIIGGIALLVALYFASSLFAQVTAHITPKQMKVPLSGGLDVKRNPQAGELGFELMSSEDVESVMLQATGKERVNTKASGTIILYNNAGAASQALVAGTRLEAPSGKIYRLNDRVTVPGKKGSTPGSVEARVTADVAGPEYNADNLDFKIPGFKGTPKYTTFYARSKSAMTGGMSGEVQVISTEDKDKARADLQAKLRKRIIEAARAELPPNFALYDEAVFMTFTDEVGTSTDAEGKTEFKQRANWQAMLFNTNDLATFIATKSVPEYNGAEVALVNPYDLNFSLPVKDSLDISKASTIQASFTGEANIVWTYDEAALKQDLYTSNTKDYQAVFGRYPAIVKAELSFRPPWLKELPKDQSKFRIVTTVQK